MGARRARSRNRGKSREKTYVVESILGKRRFEGRDQYLLKWEGYPDSQNLWQDVDQCFCDDLIEKYENEQKKVDKKNISMESIETKKTPGADLAQLVWVQNCIGNYSFRLISAIPEDSILAYARGRSMTNYRTVETCIGQKSVGDRLYFCCANWEFTPCLKMGYAELINSEDQSEHQFTVKYFEYGRHSASCQENNFDALKQWADKCNFDDLSQGSDATDQGESLQKRARLDTGTNVDISDADSPVQNVTKSSNNVAEWFYKFFKSFFF